MKEVIIATKNKGKAIEFTTLFEKLGIKAKSLLDLNQQIPDVEETGTTFSENAQLKAEHISSLLKAPVISDDSGLIIDVLNGRPGVYSARYAGKSASDEANIEKVLKELTGVPIANRAARFICVLAVASPNEETHFYTGYCEGEISKSRQGSNGFGYDPIFIPKGHSKTMAELPSNIKNRISHRTNALIQLEASIKKQY